MGWIKQNYTIDAKPLSVQIFVAMHHISFAIYLLLTEYSCDAAILRKSVKAKKGMCCLGNERIQARYLVIAWVRELVNYSERFGSWCWTWITPLHLLQGTYP